MNLDIVSYYNDRAKEYESVYGKPERQNDLLLAAEILQNIFSKKSVLEIACGTDYWTKIIAATAKSVLATDINDSVIDVAKSKYYPPAKVELETADIFNMRSLNKYESLFGGFIWSHISVLALHSFVDIVSSHTKPGATVVFIDNNYVEGSSLPVTERDEPGNTYQTRTLENGITHRVIKNFPNEDFIRHLLVEKASDLTFIKLQYYWILKYSPVR